MSTPPLLPPDPAFAAAQSRILQNRRGMYQNRDNINDAMGAPFPAAHSASTLLSQGPSDDDAFRQAQSRILGDRQEMYGIRDKINDAMGAPRPSTPQAPGIPQAAPISTPQASSPNMQQAHPQAAPMAAPMQAQTASPNPILREIHSLSPGAKQALQQAHSQSMPLSTPAQPPSVLGSNPPSHIPQIQHPDASSQAPAMNPDPQGSLRREEQRLPSQCSLQADIK